MNVRIWIGSPSSGRPADRRCLMYPARSHGQCSRTSAVPVSIVSHSMSSMMFGWLSSFSRVISRMTPLFSPSERRVFVTLIATGLFVVPHCACDAAASA